LNQRRADLSHLEDFADGHLRIFLHICWTVFDALDGSLMVGGNGSKSIGRASYTRK
jgi:hypothetical protein